MESKYSPGILASETTRRRTLKIMAGSAAATLGLPIVIDAAPQTAPHAALQAHDAPTGPYVLKYFNAEQRNPSRAGRVIIPPMIPPGAAAARVRVHRWWCRRRRMLSRNCGPMDWPRWIAGTRLVRAGVYAMRRAQKSALMEDQP
jgi:hypothetical protein